MPARYRAGIFVAIFTTSNNNKQHTSMLDPNKQFFVTKSMTAKEVAEELSDYADGYAMMEISADELLEKLTEEQCQRYTTALLDNDDDEDEEEPTEDVVANAILVELGYDINE